MEEISMEEEFSGLNLGDVRLNKRAIKLANRLMAKPTASIPMACESWSETQAAYRFLANDSIDWHQILRPHQEQTEQRLGKHAVVLCLEDTTELDFNGQEIAGLGRLNYEQRRGMYVHPTYAVTPQREPLGVLKLHMWARADRVETVPDKDSPEKKGSQAAKEEITKESARWIKGYEHVAHRAEHLPQTRLVYVADRESDMIELMWRAQQLGTPADWLIRAKHNRCLPESKRLWEHAAEGEPSGEMSFVMPSREGQKARTVRQQLWAKRVNLPMGKDQSVSVTCIVAQEINAPDGVKPVVWRLLTNREAPTLDDIIQLIDWYRARWEIEIFFHIFKNGCRIEALQLSQMDRIERALALFMVVSWRVAHLMRLGRTCPDLDAALFFQPDEIRGTYLLMKKKPPEKTPTLNDVLRLIAQLGGFLARKCDGDPGVKTIWIGLQRVVDAVTTIQMLREEI